MMLLNQLPISLPEDHINHQINLQAITFWSDDQHFLIEPNYKKSLIKTNLQINRVTGEIREVDVQGSFPIKSTKSYHMSLLMGVLEVCGHKTLVFVEQAMLVMTIKKRDVFMIKKPRLIYFEKNHKPTQEEFSQIKMFQSIFQTGLFFSYAYDLTQLIHSSEIDGAREEYYNWCHHIQRDFANVDKRWRISVIQGFAGKFEIFVKGKKLHFGLISRRSTRMPGVRYLARGINTAGDTANFVETEQIMIYESYIFSFVMLRGSLPLFWAHKEEYKGLVKNIVITKDRQTNTRMCLKHLKNIESQYGQVTVVNLLSQARKSEAKLIQCFQTIVQGAPPKALKYVYYDLNQVSNIDKAKGSNFFVQHNLKQIIEAQKFHCLFYNQQEHIKQVKEKQRGVFRVNCLDCIERTGVMQTKLSALQLSFALRHIGIDLFDNRVQSSQLQFFEDTSHPLSQLLKIIWGTNADYLSEQYTGTKSAQSYFYKPTYQLIDKLIQHAFISITRTVIDLGKYDMEKQKVIQALLGTTPVSLDEGTACVEEQSQEQISV